MLLRSRGVALVGGLVVTALLFYWAQRRGGTFQYSPQYQSSYSFSSRPSEPIPAAQWQRQGDADYLWRTITVHNPVETVSALPSAAPTAYPQVQATFPTLSGEESATRAQRQQAVRKVFQRCWASYHEHAWMSDELEPVSGGARNPFGGWAATLVDSLDTLWIMDLRPEFDEAVAAVDAIDFTKTDLKEVNVFETTIRYLGGFLSAFDLSGDARLLRKAAEVGEMIYKAFDTPSRMPITRWDIDAAIKGEKQVAGSGVLLAEIGSLCMELTRLSQLTGDAKFFDASQRVMDKLAAQQDSTALPGLWPLTVDAENEVFNAGSTFTLGAMADSVYEYLPKMAALLGGQIPNYELMYQKAMDAALERNFFRPMNPDNLDILVSGQVEATETGGKRSYELDSQGQHLVCFLGGVMALGGRMFGREQDLEAARRLTNGCIYAYKAFPHGIMPETFHMLPCKSEESCEWDDGKWKEEVLKQSVDKNEEAVHVDTIITEERLPKGFTAIPDKRYILRPEAIESVFVMYRVTAEQQFADHAWKMFTAIEEATKTELANTAVWDVTKAGTKPELMNSMESFWMGETLKYFFLIFSDPDFISLDEFVFNTEAHPFRRLV